MWLASVLAEGLSYLLPPTSCLLPHGGHVTDRPTQETSSSSTIVP